MGRSSAAFPDKPDPLSVGKVTHHSIELFWSHVYKQYYAGEKGDFRPRFTIQEEDQIGGFGTVYTGYGTSYIFDSLEPLTKYRYRIQVTYSNSNAQSSWSKVISVSTTDLPANTDHLHRAIARGDIHAVRKALSQVESFINSPNKEGYTALMVASLNGMYQITDVLLQQKADVNVQSKSGKDAIMLACFQGHLEICKILRKGGASIENRDRGGNTALHMATDGGNLDIVRWLISEGAEVDARDFVSGWTPLLRAAAMSSNVMTADLLLQCGADKDAKDKEGKTALMIAAIKSNVKFAQVLLDAGADYLVKTSFGKTAQDMSEAGENKQVARMIAECKRRDHENNLRDIAADGDTYRKELKV